AMGMGAAPALPAPISKPSLFSYRASVTPSVHPTSARAGRKAKSTRASGTSKPPKRTTEAQAALEQRKAALAAAWLAHPATVQPALMSETERRRFSSGIAKLAQSSLALEELPALLDAQARL